MKRVLVYEKSLSFKFLKSSSFCPTDEKLLKATFFICSILSVIMKFVTTHNYISGLDRVNISKGSEFVPGSFSFLLAPRKEMEQDKYLFKVSIYVDL